MITVIGDVEFLNHFNIRHCIIKLFFLNLLSIMRVCLAILLLAQGSTLLATHNRAGEITYVQTGPLSIDITITTYTKSSSSSADRDSLEFFWGDGSSQFVVRTNGGGEGVNIGNDVRVNIYEATHTYPGRSTYTMGFEDPNRVGGILNVNWPNSIDVKFFLSTTITFLDPQFDGTNSSVQLLQPPLDQACIGKVFVHNPNAFDPDGDSLSYELVAPKSSLTEDVPNYILPDKVGAGPDNMITLNQLTGEVRWDSPQLQGEYNIAIKISEWRNGRVISAVTRDMQIFVSQCNNDPPTITAIDEICVVAGDEVNLTFTIDDPNEGQSVIFAASGAPFLFEKDSATLSVEGQFFDPEYTSNLTWKTTCNHISDRYYQVVLRAEDNYFGDTTGLVALKTVRIKVVGPPPENLTSESEDGGIRLFWDNPYSCEITDDGFFQGFSVWRKLGNSSSSLDSCTTGLEKVGFSKIKFNTKDKLGDKYSFLDSGVENGVTYCYRIQAEFAQISATGIPYNRIASLHSNEVCQQLRRDRPLITKNSILTTSNSTGEVLIQWIKPLADDLDTIMNPGPYKYELHHSSDGGTTFMLLPDFTVETVHFATEIDTNYTHIDVNTADNQHRYFIKFFSNGLEYGNSSAATSILLGLNPSDKVMNLQWDVQVPWSNELYYIYKASDLSGPFVKLDSTRENRYQEVDLENGVEYCYFIQSIGSYALPSLPIDIINDSQIACAAAVDNIPPCPPELEVSNVCENQEDIVEDELFNLLTYTNPSNTCVNSDDVAGYSVYFAPFEGDSLVLIAEIDGASTLEYVDFPAVGLAGCYAISAIDFNGNESPLSNIVCVDNCPLYALPNTFTPNGDGSNDIFTPTINRFIESVVFDVYNEWGNKLYSTTNPELNWAGITNDGRELPEGTYYYTCMVFERRVAGISDTGLLLRGHINILR